LRVEVGPRAVASGQARRGAAISELQADKQRSSGTTLERRREEILAAAKPLPAHEDALIEDITDEEARIFLAVIRCT
jgi:hypothetical protein